MNITAVISQLAADAPSMNLTPQSEGLVAVAIGFSIVSNDDRDNNAKQFYVYDALYAFCRSAATKKYILLPVVTNNKT